MTTRPLKLRRGHWISADNLWEFVLWDNINALWNETTDDLGETKTIRRRQWWVYFFGDKDEAVNDTPFNTLREAVEWAAERREQAEKWAADHKE